MCHFQHFLLFFIFVFLNPSSTDRTRIFTPKSKKSSPGAFKESSYVAPFNILPQKCRMCRIKCPMCILRQKNWKNCCTNDVCAMQIVICRANVVCAVNKWRMCNGENVVCAQFTQKIDFSRVFCSKAKKGFKDLKSWWNFTTSEKIW